MSIEEARKKKENLSKDILSLIQEYESLTSITILSVEIELVQGEPIESKYGAFHSHKRAVLIRTNL